MDKKITDSIIYIGVDDKDIDLFESQYVVPNGVSYNSYVIMDDKIAIMDTADARVTDKWFANLREGPLLLLADRSQGHIGFPQRMFVNDKPVVGGSFVDKRHLHIGCLLASIHLAGKYDMIQV